MRWTKAKTNLVVDMIIMLTFLGEMASGFILWLVLPSGGYRGGLGVDTARVFLFERTAWKELHSWLAITMVAGVGLHIVLHWDWIVCMARRMWREAFAARMKPMPAKDECQI